MASVVADAGGHVTLEPAPSAPELAWMAFSTPFERGLHDASGKLVFIDYSSAGNAWNASGSPVGASDVPSRSTPLPPT